MLRREYEGKYDSDEEKEEDFEKLFEEYKEKEFVGQKSDRVPEVSLPDRDDEDD